MLWRKPALVIVGLSLLLLLALSSSASAVPPEPDPASQNDAPANGAAEPPPPEEEVARDSPRASMADFMALARANRWEEAARYLQLPRSQAQRGPVLARRIKAVLDRLAWVDIEKISPLSTGNAEDDLPRFTDEIARFEGLDGTPEPVRLVRRNLDGGRWLFSETTVSHIDGWYERLADVWMLENFPPWLLRSGPKELLWWQWFALPLLIVLGLLLGYLLSRVSAAGGRFVTSRTAWQWDDDLLKRVDRPLTLWWGLGVIYVLLPWMRLYEPAHDFVHSLMQAAFLAGFFWIMSSAVGIGGQALTRSPWARRNSASRSLIPLVTRVGHIILLVIAVIALLSQLGYPVASLLAGLGVGGLAVALAARKTLENLFGAFALGADQPFREGDFVRVGDFVGTVEYIGLRSTRFRTLDRTLITIPNGKLVDMQLESFAARDRLRFSHIVRLGYEARPEQVSDVIAGLERVLRAEPKLWPDSVTTRLISFGKGEIEIEVMVWFATTDWDEFMKLRENMLLSFLRVLEENGVRAALPTQLMVSANGAAPGASPRSADSVGP